MNLQTTEVFAPWTHQLLARAKLSAAGLDVWFGDGLTCRVPMAELRQRVGQVPRAVTLSEINEVLLRVASGEDYAIPWDFFRFRVDAAYRANMQAIDADSDRVVGARIRAWREGRGWSQTALADAAHLSRVTLSRVESGRQEATLPTLRALATVFALSVGQLVAGMEDTGDHDE